MVYYPNFIGEMAKRGIKKKDIAKALGVSYKTFYSRFKGESSFTLAEVETIRHSFFPDLTLEYLFAHTNDEQKSAKQ